jgi:hypothetical protein
MGNAVRTVGPPQALNDRGSPRRDWSRSIGPSRHGESKACAVGSSERPASPPVNRLERQAGKLARAVLRGAGAWRQAPATRPSARASLPLSAAPDVGR